MKMDTLQLIHLASFVTTADVTQEHFSADADEILVFHLRLIWILAKQIHLICLVIAQHVNI